MVIGSKKLDSVMNTDRSEACAAVVISTRTHCAVEFVILFEMQKMLYIRYG